MNNQEKRQLKGLLPYGGYKIISQMLEGKYSAGTIRAMFRNDSLKSSRKMKPEVLEAASKLVSYISSQKQE